MKNKILRQFVICVLDDENGINEAAYTNLQTLEAEISNGSCDDIFQNVTATEGRFYLPENHGLIA